MTVPAKIATAMAAAGACAVLVSACGSQGISVPRSSPYYTGAVLFSEHCSGCHTLSIVGAEGSATNVKDRLRNQGPNFNVRKETVETVLYAIRNGGFSGQIMPQNVVVGEEAQQVARFLAEYAGRQAPQVPSVETSLPGGAPSGATTDMSGAGSTGASGGTTGAAGAGPKGTRAGGGTGRKAK